LRWRIAAVGIAAGSIVALVALWPQGGRPPPPPEGFRATFLDVGQGDAALLQVKQGAVLVDQGPPEARIVRQLARLGIEKLALVVLTHPQRDHVGGAADLLRSLRVDAVLDPQQPVSNHYEDEALDVAGERGVRVVTARRGQVFRLGRLELRVLWPDGSANVADDPNDHAIVLLATYGQVDVLLTADAESNVTGKLTLDPVEVLKVAHHGSDDSGLAGLLSRLRPRVAVISVGAHNDYGHPTASTLTALRQVSGLELFRTDEDGAVVVETDGRKLTVVTRP
jgi:competence protein ComEC